MTRGWQIKISLSEARRGPVSRRASTPRWSFRGSVSEKRGFMPAARTEGGKDGGRASEMGHGRAAACAGDTWAPLRDCHGH